MTRLEFRALKSGKMSGKSASINQMPLLHEIIVIIIKMFKNFNKKLFYLSIMNHKFKMLLFNNLISILICISCHMSNIVETIKYDS